MKIVECVPNFSEGRRKDVIDAIVAQAKLRPVKVLDIESDADHNRSVLTFVGSPEAVKDAALAVSAKAIELIDLRKHSGQHPRMGAVDVVPFIPISGVTMEECIQLAKEFANEYSVRFNVPVFLYEEAATRPDRRNLADVRRGEFEGLREEIGKNSDKKPDFGPNSIHPTAGATAVGARQILIAYNINLGTGNVEVAKTIARQVRGKNGGLSAVKALGFELKDRGLVQVSMNMVDYKTSQLFKAFELVKTLAEASGVQLVESEIVGLVPMEALTDAAQFYLRLARFDKNQILEQRLDDTKGDRLIELSVRDFAAEVASDKPVPGGGSVSALAGSLAASLVSMVSRLTLKKPDCASYWSRASQILTETEALQNELMNSVDEDSHAFASLMDAYRLPRGSEQEKRERSNEIQKCLKVAAEVPLRTAETSVRVLTLAGALAEFGTENALSDLETATFLAHAGAMGAISNVSINLGAMKDKDEAYQNQLRSKLALVLQKAEEMKSAAASTLTKRRTSSVRT